MLFRLSLMLIGLHLAIVSCATSRKPSDLEVVAAYRLYGGGRCTDLEARISATDWSKEDPTRKPFFDLMNAYCLELDGRVAEASELYSLVVSKAPLTAQAYEASLRLAEIRGVAAGDATRAQRAAQDLSAAPYVPAARPIQRTVPIYSIALRAARIEGWVVIDFEVSPSGGIVDPVIVSSEPPFVFEGAALSAVRHWVYEPSASSQTRRARVRVDFDM